MADYKTDWSRIGGELAPHQSHPPLPLPEDQIAGNYVNKLNIKTIAAAVVLSQVVTFGSVLAYKAATDSPVPGIAYSKAEMQGFVTSAIEVGIKTRNEAHIASAMAVVFKKHELAPEETPNNAHVFGDLRARFTLAEFSDLECGFCKKLHPTLKEIVERSSGAVNWQWRHLPLGFHNPSANSAAVAAECYSEQKTNRGFWVFIDQWFDQSRMNGQGVKDISKFAVSLGADKNLFDSCMASGKFDELIASHVSMAEKVGASGTPATVVIDNLTGDKEFISGAQNSQAFVQVMKKMIIAGDAKVAAEKALAEGKPIDALSNTLSSAPAVPAETPEADTDEAQEE